MSWAEVPPFACGSAAPLPLTFMATPPGIAPCFTSPADGRLVTGAAAEACTHCKEDLTPEDSHNTQAPERTNVTVALHRIASHHIST